MANDTRTIKPYKAQEGGKKEQVATMFNNISKTYDMLNRMMTMGIDKIWRKKSIRSLRSFTPQLMLDVVTCTLDLALNSIRILKPKQTIGIDMSVDMLDVALKKIAIKGLQEQFELQLCYSEK